MKHYKEQLSTPADWKPIVLPSSKPTGVGPFLFGAVLLALAVIFFVIGSFLTQHIMDKNVLIFICVMIAAFVFYVVHYRTQMVILDTPTSKVHGVFIGRVEVQGIAECDNPVRAYLSDIECVWSRYQVHELCVRATNRGKKTLLKDEWVMITERITSTPFYLRDDTGSILVDPKNATVICDKVFSRDVTPKDPMYFGKCSMKEDPSSLHKRRYTEYALLRAGSVYVFGYAQERTDGVVAPMIADHDTLPMYYIVAGTQQDATKHTALQKRSFLLVLLGAYVLACFSMQNAGPKQYADLGICTAIMIIITMLIINFNRLVNLRQRVHEGFAHLDVQYKRRADLIPNLVSVIKAAGEYEDKTLAELTALRALLTHDSPSKQIDTKEASQPIAAIVENYPQLKTSENFLELQKQLADTETRIALAAAYYNDIATSCNRCCSVIPLNIVARLALVQPFPLLTINK